MSDVIHELCEMLRECGARPVFWICPAGCRGRVKWNEGCTDATCGVCGRSRSDGPLSNADRIVAYESAIKYPRHLFVGGDGRIVGEFIMGNDYRVKSNYYGGYPPTYLKRIRALFPDKSNVLHLFSGKVDTVTMPGKTVDINAENAPDYIDDAQTLLKVPVEEFDLVCADPPYSVEDCDHYQTSMVKRNVVMRTLGARLRPGAHVCWLDQVLPMFRKDQFAWDGLIGMVKSTNHRFRVVTIFRKL